MTDPIARLNAAVEGRYAIEREIGEGGMATVYLAHDERHNRNVALKVLKAELAAVVGAERFLAEIETTAKLTHPHILPLHDSGEADGFLFFVAPFIEGDTLRDKIDREKQLSIEEALKITEKVASALDYAHEQGVVHRDIKPGNILLSEKGEPTVADFGIALAVAHAGGGRVTETGLSVGTPHYMSPEQATGDRDVDPRTDVYALGSVLYEMLVGEPPYSGTTAQAVLAKILTDPTPAPTRVRVSIPPNVDAAIRKALEKLPADRFASAQEFAKALADSGFRHGEGALAGVAAGRGLWNPLSMGLGALALVFAMTTTWSLLRPEGSPSGAVPFRATLSDFDFTVGGGNRFAISSDGSWIATRHATEGASLYLRRADELEFREIQGTELAGNPTFSPDGAWVAFTQSGEIMRTQVSGGPVLPVASGGVPHWGTEELIVMVGAEGLYVVSPSGGQPRLILSHGDSLGISRPFLLPDGEAVVFQEGADLTTRRLMMVEVESGLTTDLGVAGNDPQYIPTGHLIYGHADQALMAMPFDLGSHSVTGEPFTVLPNLAVYFGGATQFAVSETGTALYVSGSGTSDSQRLVVVDLDGNEEALALPPRDIDAVGWSPDGRSVVYESFLQIYTYSVTLGTTPRQLTFAGNNSDPVFSPDGTRVAFSSFRQGTDNVDLFVKDLSDDSPPRSVLTLDGAQWVMQWPSDTLIVFEHQESGVSDLWMVNISDPDNPIAEAYLSSEADLRSIRVSPDGTHAVYGSNESDEYQFYIRSFPEPGQQTVVPQVRSTSWMTQREEQLVRTSNRVGTDGTQSERLLLAWHLPC